MLNQVVSTSLTRPEEGCDWLRSEERATSFSCRRGRVERQGYRIRHKRALHASLKCWGQLLGFKLACDQPLIQILLKCTIFSAVSIVSAKITARFTTTLRYGRTPPQHRDSHLKSSLLVC